MERLNSLRSSITRRYSERGSNAPMFSPRFGKTVYHQWVRGFWENIWGCLVRSAGGPMTQNRSTAVMQRRHEAVRSLDDFPTPPWATRALCEHLQADGHALDSMVCREPAANRGYMVRPLSEHFGRGDASDIEDYGFGFRQEDFLFPYSIEAVDWTITNPPFTLADRFVERALDTSRVGCAVILRVAFLEGVGRYEQLFSQRPPALVLQFAERVPMVKGLVDPAASSATAYAWLVWQHGHADTRLRWIPPCRKRLERASDYATPPLPADAGDDVVGRVG